MGNAARATRLAVTALIACVGVIFGGVSGSAAADETAGTHTISGRAFALDPQGQPTINVPVHVSVVSLTSDDVYSGMSDSGDSGVYNVLFVHDGRYRIQYTWATDRQSSDPFGYATTFAGGTPYLHDAATVTVAGNDVVLDVEMPRGGAVTGLLTTAAPAPQDYRTVEAYIKEPDGSLRESQSTFISGGVTAADGTYRLRGLADADYVIKFGEHDGNVHLFETQYWPGKRTRGEAATLHTRPGESITGIDATLQPWGPRVEDRFDGSDRFATAAAISRSQFQPKVPVAFVANGLNYPDALSAGPAAVRMGGPVLLVTPDTIPDAIASELERLQPQRIIVVGGDRAVSEAVFGKLAEATPAIQRIGGADRYEVSRNIARLIVTESDIRELPAISHVAFADGRGFADALSAGAGISLVEGDGALVLIDGSSSSVDAPTIEMLRDIDTRRIYIAGGTNAISQGFEDSLAGLDIYATRIGGADRYAVSAGMADWFPARGSGETDAAYFATGTDFPDALAGAAVAGSRLTNLYLVHPDCVPNPLLQRMQAMGQQSIRLLGGTDTLKPALEQLPSC